MKKMGTLKNVDGMINNLITLIKSNNDVYDGLLSYIYFRVLRLDPLNFFEIHEEEAKYYSKNDIKEYQLEFKNYDEYVVTKQLKKETEDVIYFIREEAEKSNLIKKINEYYVIHNDNIYNSEYILKQILIYYNKQKMEEE